MNRNGARPKKKIREDFQKKLDKGVIKKEALHRKRSVQLK